jgi:hypothetical protein
VLKRTTADDERSFSFFVNAVKKFILQAKSILSDDTVVEVKKANGDDKLGV